MELIGNADLIDSMECPVIQSLGQPIQDLMPYGLA